MSRARAQVTHDNVSAHTPPHTKAVTETAIERLFAVRI